MTSILSYLRSSGIVRGGWRPSPNKSYEKDDVLGAARALKEVKQLTRLCTETRPPGFVPDRAFLNYYYCQNYVLHLYNAL